jgi:hypothetical protein
MVLIEREYTVSEVQVWENKVIKIPLHDFEINRSA